MPKIIETVVYSFEELDEKAQKKAIENHFDINTNYNWWESVCESFQTLSEFFAIELEMKNEGSKKVPAIYFSIGYCQSDFSGFEGSLKDFGKLVNACKNSTWKVDFTDLEINGLPSFKEYEFLDNYIESYNENIIELTAQSSVNRCMTVNTGYYTYEDNLSRSNDEFRVEHDLMEIEKDIEKVFNILNILLFKWLKEDLECLQSDDAIKETLIINNYTFTIDGEMFNE